MAVVKHAQNVVETVIKSQRIRPIKVPETSQLYKEQSEIPNAFEPSNEEMQGNLYHLKTGMAQHYRVNNPYRYTETDEYGYVIPNTKQWGMSKEPEIGGNKATGMGALYELHHMNMVDPLIPKFRPKAFIYYTQHNHMHRVSTSKSVYGRTGPFNIVFEEGKSYRHPFDGFSRCMAITLPVMIGFSTIEDAVASCEQDGFGFEVEIPRFRYITRKSYMDNFKYRPPKKVEDD